MKKTLALVLAFTLVFSTMTFAFAEDAAIGADAKVCSDLGMLKGATGTVDAAYLATVPNRLQAAVMFLRLKGLEAEANAFTGTENFADANKVNWGKPVMAYLKAHPELGWVGDGTNFSPDTTMTAQQYYKVLLEALGYKQNTATLVGDFTWENVIAFAGSKGLTKNAAVANFTVNDLAVGTVEALKANVKDTTKTLVTTLVEAGKVDAAKATAAGVYTDDAATTTVAMSSVKAVANNKVEVTFTGDVAKAFAENAANYKIVVKGSTTALEIKSATLYSATKAVLETAVQTAGTAYTVTVGTVSANFAGLAADKTAAKVSTVECTDTNTVEVTFDKMMDAATATDIANYTLNNSATVKSAALSSSRKVVTLTTEGVANSKPYTVKVANVKNADLVVTAAVTKNFTGHSDTKAPKIDSVDAASNNTRVIVNFTDDHGVDKASAETVANYSITTDSGTLAITGIIAKDADEDDYYDQVEITTASQENGGKYTLHINNLVDGSVSANKTTSELKKEFRGKKADTTAPKLDGTPYGTTDTKFKVVFDEASRLDVATATDIANYTFNNDVVVKSAALLNSDDLDSSDAKVVVLTTSSMDEGDWYKLTVANVADEFGNVIKTVTKNVKGVAEDVQPPYVKSVKSTSQTKLTITFSERLDEASAEDPTNYVFNNGLGVALKAELDTDTDETHTVVTLTTPEQEAGKAYKVTMNNIKDENGNALADVVARVVSTLEDSDTSRPEVTSVDAPYSNVLRITFDEKVTGTAGTSYVAVGGDDGIVDSRLYMDGRVLEDGYTVEFKATDLNANGTQNDPWSFVDGTDYTIIAISGIKDLHNNVYVASTTVADMDTFTGTDLVNPGPEVDSWEQLDAQTIRVYFNEPVLRIAGTYDSETGTGIDDNQTFTVTVDPDAAADDEGYSTVDFTYTGGLNSGDVYGFNFSQAVTDYSGAVAVDADDDVPSDITDTEIESEANFTTDTWTEIEAYINDEDGPVLETAEATAKREITLTFNENLDTQGSYKVTWDDDGDVTTVSINQPTALDIDDNTITFTTNEDLDPDTVYTVTIITAPKDMAGNSTEDYKDVEVSFTGTDITTQKYIKGVKIVDAKNIIVYTSNDVLVTDNGAGVEYTVQRMNGTTVVGTIGTAQGPNDDFVSIALTQSLLAGEDYRVVVAGYSVNYAFEGIAEDGNIAMDVNDAITFSGWDLDNYVVLAVYNGTSYTVLPVAGKFDATLAIGATDGNAANGVEFGLSAGDVYTIEVYRTTVDLNGTNTKAAYDAANEGNVLYSAQFTK